MRTLLKCSALVLISFDLIAAVVIARERSLQKVRRMQLQPAEQSAAGDKDLDQIAALQRTLEDRASALRAKDKAESWAFYAQSAPGGIKAHGRDGGMQRATSEYRDFLGTLSLNPEALQHLKELLALRHLEGRCSSGLSVNVRTIVGVPDVYVFDSEYVDSLIRPLLNEEEFERFQAYNRTLPARRELANVQTSLRIGDAPLNAEQYAACVSVLAESPSPPTPQRGSSPHLIEDYVNARIKTNEARLQKLIPVLAPTQLEIFRESMESDIVQLRMRVKEAALGQPSAKTTK